MSDIKPSWLLLFIFSLNINAAFAQFTHEDSIRGTVTPERSWWDLTHYHLQVDVNPMDSTISGSNTITYQVLHRMDIIQIDLQSPLKLTSAIQNGKKLDIQIDGNAHYIQLKDPQISGSKKSLTVTYEGKPHVAIRAPWDGGITWSRDQNGNPFVASSCQGIGASIWWPCKDHMYDEPDSMMISITAPKGLVAVSNGQLSSTDQHADGKKTFHWRVTNPINNYGVNLSIGDYVHFEENYNGEAGVLDMDYYILTDNLSKARNQFKQVPMMMEAFEHWFGPYPFYKDGFKLIEVPYLGMEHQSAITYGNGYQNGYLGRDLSRSGWGLKFDFIIIHEAGHEWFANNITYQDIADMWIHESFTAYSECLYLEYHFGKMAGYEYVIGTRSNIMNDKPIIGPYGVNARGSGDMYYKGSNMLHTLRQIVDDDDQWISLFRGLNQEFYHQTVTSHQVENFISEFLGKDLSSFFDQYLRTTDIPIFEYAYRNGQFSYRWANALSGLDIPIDINIDGDIRRIDVGRMWRNIHMDTKPDYIAVDKNYYVGILNSLGN